MARRTRRILNGDLTDPLTLNVFIYSCTYFLSIVFSILSYVGTLRPESFDSLSFLVVLTDCIVPTTATLVLSNFIQNFATAAQAHITRCELSLWALLATILYVILYPSLKGYYTISLFIITLLVSIGIVILEMYAIVQVHNECLKNIRSLSA